MTGKDDKHSLLVWAASLVDQYREQQLRQWFPEATDAEIKVLCKANTVELAKPAAPAIELAIARTMKIIADKDLMDNREMMASAIELEQRAMDAIRRGLPTLPERMLFVNWDHRPAVLDGDVAFAVLVPGKPWVSVDRNDVFHTSSVLTEDAWRKRFFGRFGKLDLWAVYAATSRLPVLPEIEAPPIAP